MQAWLWLVPLALAALLLGVAPLRRNVVTRGLLALARKSGLKPGISATERAALQAGNVWLDAELFRGRLDYARMLSEPYPELTEEERRFLDRQCVTLAAQVNDWDAFQAGDLPPDAWDTLRRERFFGLIIPTEYGGLGFSARAHGEVIARLGAHSTALAVTVMVPNSLGPAELLLHYGTPEQKRHYLPRLASGVELPCFALTEPNAGSDAASITSSGVVFRGADGQPYLRLTWNKRYVTLAGVATLIGLAVRLKDPMNLLGQGTEPGITCVLVPADAPGVEHGKRHNPMGVPFVNSPVRGTDVVVAATQIVGGAAGAGRGWQMLMECLAAGRALSLPSLSAGGAKGLVRVTSAYAVVRRQFGQPIGRFEGIEEPLARIAGLSYLMDAARVFTAGAVDRGVKPAVVSAMVKYTLTELSRGLVNDAMDVLGGAGISRGPRNLVANAYIAAPIGVTVEGANILTRSLIVFGQGALRCHPFAWAELSALEQGDLPGFDRAVWGHAAHLARALFRAAAYSVSRGRLARVPRGALAPYYRKLARASASFAVLAELAMLTQGGRLKLRESLTGRYADLMAWMYLGFATLRRYEAEGRPQALAPAFRYAMEHALARLEQAFDGVLANFRAPVVGALLRGPVRAWSRLGSLGSGPRDALVHALADEVQRPGALREALTDGLLPVIPELEAAYRLETAFLQVSRAGQVLERVARASRQGTLRRGRPNELLNEARLAGGIGDDDLRGVRQAEHARDDAVQVDAFPLDEPAPVRRAVGASWSAADRPRPGPRRRLGDRPALVVVPPAGDPAG